MCRLLGVVSSERADFGFSLRDAPRSLQSLSREHPHGWGLAVHDGPAGWEVHRQAACACDDGRFGEVVTTARGRMLVAHVRKATVGPTSCLNTHPFRRDRWAFAHNGTIRDVAFLIAQTSWTRATEVEGDTDSERFFAYLLTALDELGSSPSRPEIDAVIASATARAIAQPDFGSLNFLLSDGDALYAHRFGRTLFVLERGRADAVIAERASTETDAVLRTSWSPRRIAALVASEVMTDEPWVEVEEGTLLVTSVGARPRWTRPGGKPQAPAFAARL